MVKEIITKAYACERSMLCQRYFAPQGRSNQAILDARKDAERHESLDSEHIITCQDPTTHATTILLVRSDHEPLTVLARDIDTLTLAQKRAIELAHQLRDQERQYKPFLSTIGADFPILDIGTYWGIPKQNG